MTSIAVTFSKLRYLPEDVIDGDIRNREDNTRLDTYTADDVMEVVTWIRQEFGNAVESADGTLYASVDGGRTVDYATGEVEEVTIFLDGGTDLEYVAIESAVLSDF
jgi:hypothetical protein